MKRPITVTLLALLAGLAGLVAAVDVIRLLVPTTPLGGMAFSGPSLFGPIFASVIAVIWFWAAAKLWKLDSRGWYFVVVVAVTYLIFDALALMAGVTWESVSVSLILSAIALILCLLPSTKAAFGQV